MPLLNAYVARVQSEVQQGPVTRMTAAEAESFLAAIRRGDQVLEALLSVSDKSSYPIAESP